MKNQKISRCLISVHDKESIVELAKILTEKFNVEIISTGGTYKLLKQNNIKVKEVSDYTSFPEIMDGRVKTLHPKIHGGLLAILNNETHQNQMQQNNIESIDLLIVNLYPFAETLARTDDEKEIIENIDIGGPAMIRSAAKNFAYKTVITNKQDYPDLLAEMEKNKGEVRYDFRKKCAAKSFGDIAIYDRMIADYFASQSSSEQEFPQKLAISANLKQNLRYGENSHQIASVYSNCESGIVNAKQLQGKELSYNNFNDADAAYNLALEFDNPSCIIVKHANPCGVASGENLLEAFKKSLDCDPKSAFGGIVALNGKIEKDLAQELTQTFFEVIIAKEISEEAKNILATKKNLRVLITAFKNSAQSAKNEKSFDFAKMQIKSISGGFLIQENDVKKISAKDLKQVSKIGVSQNELEELVFAMKICKHVKSNAIVVTQKMQSLGIGSGQTSRIDACEIACKKAGNKARHAFLASDAFFPFADNIEIAANFGIKALVAPSGSIRDEEVIKAANDKNLALYFLDNRFFKH